MEPYQRQFIEFAIKKKALCFGEFKLKSGRISPYFFNSGCFNDGESLAQLGQFYAAAVTASALQFDTIYGPAYKGIPLAATLAMTLQQQQHINYPICFNRKEIKDHGEGGITFGAKIGRRVLVIDDVISAGTSIRQSMDIINTQGGKITSVVIALDRQERDSNKHCSAIQELVQTHHINVISIINLDQLITYLKAHTTMKQQLAAIKNYRIQYGAKR